MQRARAVVAAINGDDSAVDALVQQHFAPVPGDSGRLVEHRQLFASLRKRLGPVQPGGLERRDAQTVALAVTGSTGEGAAIVLTLEPKTSLITAITIDEPEAPALPRPPIRGSMTAEELGRELHPYLDKLAAAGTLSGTVLVARDGKPVFARAYGLANIADNVPNTLETRFNLGSINKHFTKAVLAMLMSEGKLAMSDVVAKHLPDYPNGDAAKSMTLQQLLDHTAGIPDYMNTPEWAGTPKSELRANADYLRLFANKPLKWTPGERSEYCNSCYVVLGAVIEKIAGIPYEDVVARRIFGPAGMTGAGFFSSDDPIRNMAIGYTRQSARSVTSPLRSNLLTRGPRGNAAGGAFATAHDLLAWDNAMREGRLLDAKATAWFYDIPTPGTGRVLAGNGVAGGAAGVNAVIESDGVWTVVVLTNFDPPTAVQLGGAIYRQLR